MRWLLYHANGQTVMLNDVLLDTGSEAKQFQGRKSWKESAVLLILLKLCEILVGVVGGKETVLANKIEG